MWRILNAFKTHIMKNVFLLFCSAVLLFGLSSFSKSETAPADKINWMTWEEAVAATEKEPRKIMVDLYTHWCGWCKVMDKKTFTDPEIIKIINEDFYAVKFNAEQKETIRYNGTDFDFVQSKGSKRGGVHMLAYSLTNGQLSYPTLVYLNEKMERISISPGYKEIEQLKNELEFTRSEYYNKGTFEEFVEKQN